MSDELASVAAVVRRFGFASVDELWQKLSTFKCADNGFGYDAHEELQYLQADGYLEDGCRVDVVNRVEDFLRRITATGEIIEVFS